MNRARLKVAGLTLSAAAIVSLVSYEGFRSQAYDDGVGVQTYGFGTTRRPDGTPVQPGDTIDPVTALAHAQREVTRFEGALKQCVKVPLHQHEYDAYVSFAYNVGAGAFCSSTLVRKLNAGDYEGACNELPRWVYAGGRKLQGLVNRREAERRLCLGLS